MLAAIAMVASCSDGNDDVIMNRGYHLVYIHRLPECVTAWQNDYAPNTIDTTVADLRVSVTCSQMKGVDSPDISEG